MPDTQPPAPHIKMYPMAAVLESGPDDSPALRIQLATTTTGNTVWTVLYGETWRRVLNGERQVKASIRTCTDWGTPRSTCRFHDGGIIGTEATRAAIIQNLFTREYVRTEKKKWLVSTEKGRNLIDILPPVLTDPATTARWEQALEEVAAGRAGMDAFLALQSEFVAGLVSKLKAENPGRAARVQSGGSKPAQEDGPIYPCPTCHKPMRRRQGKNGWFWGCSAYPECRQTLPDEDGKPGLPPPDITSRADRPAPPVRVASAPGKAGEKCPTCDTGTLVLRSHNGKPFLGCSGFPACRYFYWIRT